MDVHSKLENCFPTNNNGKIKSENNFKEWMKCYSTLSSVVDKTGRRFWFDPMWESFIPEEYSQK